jgi:hypothetical protein
VQVGTVGVKIHSLEIAEAPLPEALTVQFKTVVLVQVPDVDTPDPAVTVADVTVPDPEPPPPGGKY